MSSWQSYGPRRRVANGLAVATPGDVVDADARALADAAASNASSGVLARGRAYARDGQTVSATVADGQATVAVQGSGSKPYKVRLSRPSSQVGRVRATCDCPFGCAPRLWCKHAVVAAFVVAAMIDTDPSLRRSWNPARPAEVAVAPQPLKAVALQWTPEQVMAAALDVLALPSSVMERPPG